MTRSLRVGVVGAGLAGSAHALAIRWGHTLSTNAMPELQPVAIASADAVRGGDLQRRSGFERHVLRWEELLDLDLDGVVIAGANDAHVAPAVAFLDAGVHVLSEKPLAGSVVDARRMVRASARSASLATVGFGYRWVPAVEAMRRSVASGEIGALIHVRGRYWADYSGSPTAPHGWRHRGAPPAGVLADIGSHVVDLAEFIIGERVREVGGAVLRTVFPQRPGPDGTMLSVENEDLAVFTARLGDSVVGEFSVSRVTAGTGNGLSLEIVGTEGTLRWDFDRAGEYSIGDRGRGPGARIFVSAPSQPYMAAMPMPIPGAGVGIGDVLSFQARAFLEEMADLPDLSGPRLPNFSDGLRSMIVLDAVAESARNGGRFVQVEEDVGT